MLFQSTHPRGVRPLFGDIFRHRFGSFNPRTRVGCDWSGLVRNEDGLLVSIHAPAWGATLFAQFRDHGAGVSIHAPAWGATVPCAGRKLRVVVSIHAPAWGATPRPAGRPSARPGFNPRTRVGCDGAHGRAARSHAGFNPRTRVGCDTGFSAFWPRFEVSIHAPAWGATSGISACSPSQSMFQSTHPRGVRRRHLGGICHAQRVSIHAPAWGATHVCGLRWDPAPVSIHAPAWGATRRPAKRQKTWRPSFNPRTRVGCDSTPPASKAIPLWFQSTHPRGVRQRAILA